MNGHVINYYTPLHEELTWACESCGIVVTWRCTGWDECFDRRYCKNRPACPNKACAPCDGKCSGVDSCGGGGFQSTDCYYCEKSIAGSCGGYTYTQFYYHDRCNREGVLSPTAYARLVATAARPPGVCRLCGLKGADSGTYHKACLVARSAAMCDGQCHRDSPDHPKMWCGNNDDIRPGHRTMCRVCGVFASPVCTTEDRPRRHPKCGYQGCSQN
jgi:hypothetical protein